MNPRTWINEHNQLVLAIVVGAMIVAGVTVFLSLRSGKNGGLPTFQAYYTTDDGLTYFPDRPHLIPPFDHDGKEAVRADLYAGPDGKPFVGVLAKFSPAGRQALQVATDQTKWAEIMVGLGPDAALIKRPGDSTWVSAFSPAGRALRNVCLPGTNTPAQRVLLLE